jgi:hypothetical protein
MPNAFKTSQMTVGEGSDDYFGYTQTQKVIVINKTKTDGNRFSRGGRADRRALVGFATLISTFYIFQAPPCTITITTG